MNVVLRAKENVSNAALGQIVDLNLKSFVQRQRIAQNAPPPDPASLEITSDSTPLSDVSSWA